MRGNPKAGNPGRPARESSAGGSEAFLGKFFAENRRNRLPGGPTRGRASDRRHPRIIPGADRRGLPDTSRKSRGKAAPDWWALPLLKRKGSGTGLRAGAVDGNRRRHGSPVPLRGVVPAGRTTNEGTRRRDGFRPGEGPGPSVRTSETSVKGAPLGAVWKRNPEPSSRVTHPEDTGFFPKAPAIRKRLRSSQGKMRR